MLSDMATYAIADFMAMTPEVWFRLFERLNSGLWPWQLLAPVLLLGAVAALRRGQSRLAGILLGLCWVWVALAFHFSLYAEVSPAGLWLGWAFLLQALLLVCVGWLGRLVWSSGPRAIAGMVLLGFAVLVYPLLGPLTGRSWLGLEVPGTAPEPTLMATLALLLVTPRLPWLLVPIPVLAGLLGALTWWAMGWA